MKVGILGAGQLGRMLALAGYPLGQRFVFLDPGAESSAGQVGALRVGAYDDEERLTELARKPSEYVHGHLRFTPFAGEPVGWMIEQAGADLFMFSTDYPHPEGGRDPLAKFEEAMPDVSEDDRHRFYYQNMADLLGPILTPARPAAA